MGLTEWLLLAAVILVPLAIAAAVTLWSLEQVRYRPKRPRRPRPVATEAAAEPAATSPTIASPPAAPAAQDRARPREEQG